MALKTISLKNPFVQLNDGDDLKLQGSNPFIISIIALTTELTVSKIGSDTNAYPFADPVPAGQAIYTIPLPLGTTLRFTGGTAEIEAFAAH